MRRCTSLPVVLSLVAALHAAPAFAQMPVDEAFTTADGVKLKGIFHPSANGA